MTGISYLQLRSGSATFPVFPHEMVRYVAGGFECVVIGSITIPSNLVLCATWCLFIGYCLIDYISGVGWQVFLFYRSRVAEGALFRDGIMWSALRIQATRHAPAAKS